MAARRRSPPVETSLETLLWREACEHLDLAQSVQRVFTILAKHIPIRALAIMHLHSAPMHLATVATGAPEGSDDHGPWPVRFNLDDRSARELGRLIRKCQLSVLSPRQSQLAQALLAQSPERVVVAVPLLTPKHSAGQAILFARVESAASQRHLALLALSVRPLRVAYENHWRFHELGRLREALEADREALLTRLQRQDISEVVIGESGGLAMVMERAAQVAPTDAPVLILGETGSGKEVIARAIHARSRRARGPVVRVNCGAIPTELVDSELFGHERGAFTGAIGTRKGWFERADGGTLFLDEIAELPLAAQVRLLRVLQDGTLERVGGHQTISVDVRIVAATHRHLEAMVAEGSFREDLWYRLSIFPIRLPALRERMEDLPALAAHFAEGAGRRLGGSGLTPTSSDIELLCSYSWPGNVRELAAVIERAAILGNGKWLEIRTALGDTSVHSPSRPPAERVLGNGASGSDATRHLATLDAAMADHITQALKACRGRIEGPFGAATLLGINPHTLRARMRKLGLEWSQFRTSDSNLAS